MAIYTYRKFIFSFKQVLGISFLLLGVGFFLTQVGYAKDTEPTPQSKQFDSLYTYTATGLAATNNDSAFLMADNLYRMATNDLQKLRVLMLTATLHKRKGNTADAINHAKQAYELSVKNRNKEWQLRINGFLSTAYRTVGLYDVGKKHLEESKLIVSKMQDASLFSSFISQEQAYYYLNSEEYDLAIDELLKSESSLSAASNQQLGPFFGAINDQIVAICYLRKGDDNLAEKYYQMSLNKVEGIETELKGFNYCGLAEIAYRKGQYEKVLPLLQETEKYATDSKNYDLRLQLFDIYSRYYGYVGNSQLALHYNNEYVNLLKDRVLYISSISNDTISIASTSDKQKLLTSRNIILSVLLAFAVLFIYFILTARKNTKERVRYKQIISSLSDKHQGEVGSFTPSELTTLLINEKNVVEVKRETTEKLETPTLQAAKPAPVKSDIQVSQALVSKNTIEDILKKLDKLEKSTFFLQPDVSLAKTATALGTNTKYLSYVVNNQKGVDFNGYVNQIRIDYIINKLKTNTEYLDYKISYLAEKCGFSTHSRFTAIFKQLIGISPSDFINALKEERKVYQGI